MKKSLLAILAMASLIASAQASPVLLGEVYHDYGSATGKYDPAGNDVLAADYVTVSDQSSQRFSDVFDFSAFSYSTVGHFKLTLTFSSNQSFLEYWAARPGASSTLKYLNQTGNTVVTQDFIFDSSVDTFSSMVTNEKFNLWFAEQGPFAQNFRVYDAKLAVYGDATAVPEPATASIMLVALAGLALSRRRKG